jgi:hypothetical protein
MATLVGTNTFCDAAVGTTIISGATQVYEAYPNPFRSHIYLKQTEGNEYFELIKPFGQIVVSGKNIHQQDFSHLESGMYFLRIVGKGISVIKMYKA